MANPVENLFGPAFAGSAVTAFFGWLALRYGRKKSSGEVGDVIATGFGKLVDQLQQENTRHLKQIADLSQESHRLRNQLQKLRLYADALFRHIAQLEQAIADHGGAPPRRPDLPSPD